MRKLFLFALSISIIYSCKKESTDAPQPPDDGYFRTLIDTAASYSFWLYLWADKLPDTYTYSHNSLDDFMVWIRKYSLEPGFNNKPVDRWSFAMKQSEWDDYSSGRVGDFGLDISYTAIDDLRIMRVDKNGSAYNKGLRRGDKIIEVNGRTDLSYNQTNISFLNEAFYISSNPLNIKVQRGGNVISTTINVTSYIQNPISLDTVYNINNKKIGYFVYENFLGDSASVVGQLGSIFQRFKNENIEDLIVDLRYNGGGYGYLTQELSNYVIPSGNDDQILYSQTLGPNSPLDTLVYKVKKVGNIELSKVYVITTGNTASASEAFINSVNPYIDVVIVGDTTHGKPVGYFPVPVGEYYIFPVSLRLENKNQSGNYFNGFAPHHLAADNFTYDWGNTNENSLNKAISLITGTPQRVNNINDQKMMRDMKDLNRGIQIRKSNLLITNLYPTQLQEIKTKAVNKYLN